MPIIHVYLTPPLDSAEKKEALFRALTEAVTSSLGKPPEQTRILLHELDDTDWAVAGTAVRQRLAQAPKVG
jgi:4-oxalocrotonate tautomerase family enzyme